MENFQKIKIEKEEYFIVDSIQNLRAEDSFIHRKNKLKLYKGNGEARKYIGSYLGKNGDILNKFFEYSNWGKNRDYETIQDKTCFFSKSNLLKYLYDAKIEYQKQEQIYNNDISDNYNEYLEEISNINDEIIYFSIHDVSDLIDNKNKSTRGYIRSSDDIWDIWRKIILPKISYLSILKIISVDNKNEKKAFFYFRILLDYEFRSIVHPQLINSTIEITDKIKEKKQIIKSKNRKIPDFRKKVLEHMPQCPFTKISDDKLLIASHIKPYNICIKEDREDQAGDYLNGLSLTPTYDKLFDQGYITFKDNGDLVCGTMLSKYTWDKLNINPNSKNNMRIYPENREKYLDYHRKYVFLDNIDDIV